MPVKGQMNKTRTAKSKVKSLKLKWWYVLPVIAIVAAAGYLVIRYSQAGVTSALRGGFGNKRLGGKNTTLLRDGRPVKAIVSVSRAYETQVSALASRNAINGKKACAKVWVGNFAGNQLTGKITVQPYLWAYDNLANALEYASMGGDVPGGVADLFRPEAANSFYGPFKSSNLITKTFKGKNQWVTTCVTIPNTTASRYKKYKPIYAVVSVYTNVPPPDSNAVKYPIGVDKIWLQN